MTISHQKSAMKFESADDDAGRHRQLGAEAFEEGGEDRDDLPEDDRDHDDGDGDDGDRVDHRRLHLAVQLDRLLDVVREALQDRVEDTARLAGGDHVGEEVVEDLGMLAHRVGEVRARLDVLPDLDERALEGLVLLLRGRGSPGTARAAGRRRS